MNLRFATITAELLVSLASPLSSDSVAAQIVADAPVPDRQTLAAEKVHRYATSVRLRVPGGDDLGSGVIFAETEEGYWIVTNRHVVQGQPILCVIGADQRIDPALVLPPVVDQRQAALDIAYLWLPRGTGAPRMVAERQEAKGLAEPLPIVVSTGYPIEVETGQAGPLYKEMEGLLLPLLDRPLEGGYDLTYAMSIGKGMSGGGLFHGTRLIGINGVHADPLWLSPWRWGDGGPISPVLNRKLELVSMGIQISTIEAVFRQTQRPSARQIQSLAKETCEKVGKNIPNQTLPSAKPPKQNTVL